MCTNFRLRGRKPSTGTSIHSGFTFWRKYFVLFEPRKKLLCRVNMFLISALLTLLLCPSPAHSQVAPDQLRPFPQLFNAAANRPIQTDPSQSTCGYPERNAYCKSSTITASLDICNHNFCVQTCPVSRDTLPQHVSLLDASSSGSGTCVEIDTINVRPGSVAETSTFISQAGPTCFLTPRSASVIGDNGAFTITVWIWQENNNDGLIFEKVDSASSVIVSLQVSQTQVYLLYRASAGLSGVTLNETIPSRIWTHLSIQMYDRTVSFFLDGLHSGYSPVSTEILTNQIQDSPGEVRIGQSKQGNLQFLGRLQDFRFYSHTLSNREIELVYSGSLPSVRIQSLCRCPASHPRVRPTQTHFCIRNGEPDNTGEQILRLNPDAHPVEYANDGDSNSIWISRFQDNVSLTLDLGDLFQVFYVVLQFYSPLPRAVVMEKKVSDIAPWQQWQSYADDCEARYGLVNTGPLLTPTSVNCLQFGIPSLPLPTSKGNITFNALSPEPQPRPGHNDFYNTAGLYEFVSASQVKVSLSEHFNVTQPRHKYHGVFDLVVSARCECNGHAETCNTDKLPYRCDCLLRSHTQGRKCEECQPLFNDKSFRRGDPINAYPCKECQCYNHADSCVYDKGTDPFPDDHDRGGGGVCASCRNHTVGRNCETCDVYYYRPEGKSLYDEDVCQQCLCNTNGVAGNTMDCEKVGGACKCKPSVEGRTCDTCNPGFYSLELINPMGCDPCGCAGTGTVGGDITCHPTTGQCNCKANVRTRQCNVCEYGYYGLNGTNPDGCFPCNCDPRGSSSTFCEAGVGQCSCKANIVGRQCDQCAPGYFNFESGCQVCQCDLQGAEPGTTCNKTTGKCICKTNTQGDQCNQCSDGSYSFGSSQALGCISCNCDPAGTEEGASICDKTSGLCDCKRNVAGRGCNQCKGNTWGLNVTNPLGCELCDCDSSGTQLGGQVPDIELTCNQNSGQCTCLANRAGRMCDDCVPGFYVDSSPGGGCVTCQCHPRGTLPGTVCDSQTGQCECRGADSGLTGQSCSICLPKYYNFDVGTGRCTPCNCHPAGSLNDTCNSVTGQCSCKDFVQGIQCDSCVAGASVLDSNNPFGCSKAPAQQPPPEHVPLSATSLQLSWLPPDYPNGVIKEYKLYRNGGLAGTIVSTDSKVVYNDTGLVPFTAYSYVVEAVNDFGSVRSEPITFVTPAGIPGGVLTLRVTNKQARRADFSWNTPSQPNGRIDRYVLRSSTKSNSNVSEVQWEGIATFQTLTDLLPFTDYTFVVQVCTSAGCLSSSPVTFNTLSALPEGQQPPAITAVSSTELFLQWDPPTASNGIISFYELWMREPSSPSKPATRIFHPSGQYNPRPTVEPEEKALSPPQTNYSKTGLEPYTPYEFQILSQNDAGKAASIWVAGQTLEAAPLSMPTPVVVALSSYRLNVSWSPPSPDQARGVINTYRLFQLQRSTNPSAPPFTWQLVKQLEGTVTSWVVIDLQPYTDYRFYVEACNSVDCVQSSEGLGRTQAAAPEGLLKPSVDGVNSSAIGITWSPPLSLNGPDPLYKVERTSTALNYPSRVVRGTRFPGQGFYKFPPNTIPQNVGFTGIEFWFRTRAKVGLLFFAASDGQQEEFILLQFVAGRPRFVFDPQACLKVVELSGLDDSVTFDDDSWHKLVATRSEADGKLVVDDTIIGCPAIAQPTNDEGLPYNDGKWHHLIARRYEKSGNIRIDNIFTGETTSRCDQGNVIGTNTGVFIGGLDPNFKLRRNFGADDRRAALVDRGFRGCVRDFKILRQVSPVELWEELDWQSAEVNEQAFPNWEGCPVNLEPGLHYMGRGFAALPQSMFDGGDVFSISLTFRTELKNGLLFFSHGGRGIFVLGELRDRSINFVVSNGQQQQSASFQNSVGVNFCDGQWRRVTFAKEGTQLNITVRDQGSQIVGDVSVTMEMITVSNLFVGGIPTGSEATQFIRDNSISITQGFGGCLSDISINDKMISNFGEEVVELLNVNMDGCPQYQLPTTTCQNSLDQEIYQGTENATIDQGLQPYTEYLYRVVAENSAGSGSSPWTNGKTREAAPAVVNAPNSASSPNGHVIQVFWSNPTDSPGLLTKLILRAYNLNEPTQPVIETNLTDVAAVTGSINGVVPFTSYNVKLVACSSGGCTESLDGSRVVTREEAPEDVAPPTADPGPTHLAVKWIVPGLPNGDITGYILRMNSVEIYSGGEISFNVTGLQVYTGYIFSVEACTKQGCTSSPTAVLTTSQLPPTSVNPPRLQSLGTNQVEAQWEPPTQLNGVLERYQLFVSLDDQTPGNLVYNNSDLFLTYVIPNLNAGTNYFIRLAACTGGGCRQSSPSAVTTEESSPEGVPDPMVNSPSSTQLFITWGVPSLPNGIIIRYELQHNGLKVFDTPDRREYSIANLLPYSVHSFRVRVCTVKGCGSSAVVEARTQEAPPIGFVNIVDVKVLDPRTVSLQWLPPNTPNGILFYDVYFSGFFYVDPENWNYNVIEERRSLYRNTTDSIPVTIENLIPYSRYSVQVNASNTKGFLLSNIRQVDMPAGSPDGVRPPTLESRSPSTITAIWVEAGRSNSDTPPLYTLQRRGTTPGPAIIDVFGPTSSTTFLVENLQPFTEYEFRLVAENNFGRTSSSWASMYTKQTVPTSLDPPRIVSIQSNHVDLEWNAPLQPNGIVTEYAIYQNNALREKVPSNQTSLRADGLDPNNLYVFQLSACTVAGCTLSGQSSEVMTLQAVPQGISAPTLTSPAPTSVQVRWTEPSRPNGVIRQYTIERRNKGDNFSSVDVTTVSALMAKVYTDNSAELSPFTSYEYRIRVTNDVGTGSGPWQEIVTASSRPGGMRAPTVNVLGPRSIEVMWEEPIQTNGELEYYTLLVPPFRQEVRNISQLRVVLDGLTPYTTYTATITACTSGGCTESAGVTVLTELAAPEDQLPPNPNPISQTMIAVTWEPPSFPNGPGIRYELASRKTRQPLDTSATNFGLWNSVYSGELTYFEDRGLTLFTMYQYRVTVFNTYSQLVSGPSIEVATFGGTPQRPASVSVRTLNHESLFVNWTDPSVTELQGEIVLYSVDYTSLPENETVRVELEAGNDNITLINLKPNTDYTISLTITINGGGSIASPPITATTMDGAPEGLPPPELLALSDTSLQVIWTEPNKPNGQVVTYNIYLDGEKILTNQNTPGSYIINNLQPYTVYHLQMEVCTVYDCVKSNTTRGATAEALPQGVISPDLASRGTDEIDITWQPPVNPNGIILNYKLTRSTVKPCSEINKPVITPPSNKCFYVTCGQAESLCGDTCYTGPKVCCEGVLHEAKPSYECCGTEYIPSRTQPDDVCCAGKFRRRRENYKCCGNRYEAVLAGQVCCVDSNQDRVSVGYGDTCCDAIPYSSNGPQICCAGTLRSGYSSQCCGGEMVDEDLTCCGNDTSGLPYSPGQGYQCCGSEYVPEDSNLCCTHYTGDTKVHVYSNATRKSTSNEKCCGLEIISAGLSCCNFVGYNPLTQVCADTTGQDTDCGRGRVCSVSQTNSAICDQCQFDTTNTVCRAVLGSTSPSTVIAPLPENTGEECEIDTTVIYRGLQLSFTDSGLSAYTRYRYRLTVTNSAGSSEGPASNTRTQEAVPQGLQPPTSKVYPDKLYIIHLSWKPPQIPNGVIIHYKLNKDGLELYRGLDLQYTDNDRILPYRSYIYVLSACTKVGCADSNEISVATAQAPPEGVQPPSASVLSATSVQLEWSAPTSPNGQVVLYSVIRDGRDIIYNTSSQLQHIVRGLSPFTDYRFSIRACTAAGCSESSEVTVQTLQTRPQGLNAPRFLILSSSVVQLFWLPPRVTNGEITTYNLFQTLSGETTLSFTGGPQTFTTIQSSLTPGAQYMFTLEAVNGGGSANSSATVINMPLITPPNIPAPKSVTVLGPTSLSVEWNDLQNATQAQTQRDIDQYRVLLNGGTSTEIDKGVGLALSTVVGGLQPYTEYSVRLRVCLQGVANGCGTGPELKARTSEAPPIDQGEPLITALASNMVEITWKSPSLPNGLISQYRIHQRTFGSSSEILINQVDGDTLSFRHAGADLLPFTEYEFKITAVNGVGEVSSPWGKVLTLEATPVGMRVPDVSVSGAYAGQVTWQEPRNPNGVILTYDIEYRILGDDPTIQSTISVVTVAGDLRTTVISGLQPFTSYNVRVTAKNSVGSAVSNWVTIQTAQASPSGLGTITVEKLTSGKAVILRWGSPQQSNGIITTYRIYENGNTVAIYQGLNKEFEFRRLQPFTEYTIQLEACTEAGCTTTTTQKFITAEIAPSAQVAPTLGESNATSVILRWQKPLNPNGRILSYEVLRRTNTRRRKRDLSDPIVVQKIEDTEKDSFEFVDSDLRPNTEYQYKIRAINAKGSSDSPWVTIKTSEAPPAGVRPPVVEYIPGDVHALYITWTTPEQTNGIIQSYLLQRDNDSPPWSFTASDPKQFTDRNLEAYTEYSYRITACSAGGCTPSPPTSLHTKETAPLLTQPPSLEALSATEIKATWKEPAITNGEIIMYQLKQDGAVVYAGLLREYTSQGLEPFKEYEYSVTACTNGGCTDSVSVRRRPEAAAPTDIAQPVLRVLSASAVEVSWAAPRNPNGLITSYDLRRNGSLVYTQSLAGAGILRTTFTDYNLEPGILYSYTITATNNKGSVTSPPARTLTYSSSPSGMKPPELVPLTAFTVQASWEPPSAPNGDLQNYTLYQANDVKYSGPVDRFSYIIPSLQPWTEYTFRVQVCTNRGCELSPPSTTRTLEAMPQNQGAPQLLASADFKGTHNGVRVTWSPPDNPNGAITHYVLHRQSVIKNDISGNQYGELAEVFNGSQLDHFDNDVSVRPYFYYRYSITAYNKIGSTQSVWQEVFTKEAPPQGIPVPIILNATARTLTVQLRPPSQLNGVIVEYNVRLNGTVWSRGPASALVQTPGAGNSLTPFSTYLVQSEACTRPGCTLSEGVVTMTTEAQPTGLDPITVLTTSFTSAELSWKPPKYPNGIITRYIVYQRRGCPKTDQPFTQRCVVGEAVEVFSGLALSLTTKDLLPYTAYDFQVQVVNGEGMGDFTVWVSTQTKPTAPVFIKLPKLSKNGSLAVIDWTQSFQLNSRLQKYTLSADGTKKLEGINSVYSMERTLRDAKILFKIEAETELGKAISPDIIFDPNAVDNIATVAPSTSAGRTAEVPVYQEVWFIVLMCVIALLLFFIILAFCIKRMTRPRPYIRERLPLEARQKKTDMTYEFSPYTGSVAPDDFPTRPYSDRHVSQEEIGMINPAFTNASLRPYTIDSDDLDLTLDNISKTSKFDDEDDISWGKPGDSGLYEDDLDSLTAPSYSITKEQMIFTDTHL